MKFKSIAIWPLSAHSVTLCNQTDDTHDTYVQAQAVCDFLSRNGWGGEGEIFPKKTYVEPVN